jgi:hypothetical protein
MSLIHRRKRNKIRLSADGFLDKIPSWDILRTLSEEEATDMARAHGLDDSGRSESLKALNSERKAL